MILIISTCKEKLHELEFVKPVEKILKENKFKYLTKHYLKLNKKDFEKSSKVIICGTSLKDNKFLKDIKKFSWIESYKKPIFGICAGSHIIGLLEGKNLKKQEEIGLKKIKLNFLGISEETEVYHLHKFAVLPEIFHEENIYATLFHPEVRNKNIIEEFIKL